MFGIPTHSYFWGYQPLTDEGNEKPLNHRLSDVLKADDSKNKRKKLTQMLQRDYFSTPTEKFASFGNPISEEKQKKKMEPVPAMKSELIQKKYKEREGEILASARSNEEKGMRLLALDIDKMNGFKKTVEAEAESEFVNDFRAFLLGHGKPKDYEKIGWIQDGVKNRLLEKPRVISTNSGVVNWLEKDIKSNIAYQRDIAKLKLIATSRNNWTLPEAWAIYKFLVRGAPYNQEEVTEALASTGANFTQAEEALKKGKQKQKTYFQGSSKSRSSSPSGSLYSGSDEDEPSLGGKNDDPSETEAGQSSFEEEGEEVPSDIPADLQNYWKGLSKDLQKRNLKYIRSLKPEIKNTYWDVIRGLEEKQGN